MGLAVKVFNHFETPKDPGVYYRLICLTGKGKGKAYFLMGKRIVMGRSDEVDVTVLDMKSSREHAEIINVGGSFILTDLGSQNGIIINDFKVKQHTLKNGDKIIIGKTVFKFSRVEVKEGKGEVKLRTQVDDEPDDFNDQLPQNKKMNLGLVGVLIFAVIVLLTTENSKKSKPREKAIRNQIRELETQKIFQQEVEKRNEIDRKNKEKLSIYFQRGLREYRESNYFRAMEEFKNAQTWSPSDRQAKTYFRMAEEKLREQIQLYFSSATQNIEAVKYREAAVSYCNVMKLLIRNKNDERYKEAVTGLKSMESNMGFEEGEFDCLNEEGAGK